jgi:hypothetical protein
MNNKTSHELNEAMMTVILQAYNSFTGVDGIQ